VAIRRITSRSPPSLSTSAFCHCISAVSDGSFATSDVPSVLKYFGSHWAAKWVIVDS